jgi:DNA-binding transcriptional MerR regulator
MQIGELAQRAGSQPETVRYYERLGLLPAPERTGGNYRVYDDGHLERLRFIRNCRAIGMTLGEVGRLLYFRDRPELACREIDQLLDTHITRLEEQLGELYHLEGCLRELRSWCASRPTVGDRGLLAGLNATAPSVSLGDPC